ncbi:MAG: hypothetical protein KGM15_02975 [Pseudomonadota bacterium]|nr:hypothetical protein [Pseudomonadota bacterium]
MSAYDLTTLANVKAWLGLPSQPTASDAMLTSLVTSASRTVYAILSRTSLLPASYTETIDVESDRVYLAHWPVMQVNSVILDGLVVPPATPASAQPAIGYLLQPADGAPPGRQQALDLFGRRYHRLRQGLVVSYQAGYAVQGESWTAPSAAPYQLVAAAPFGAWASDLGVVYASSGTPLLAVKSAPAAGQYSVAAGVYHLNAADAGAAVSLSYGFVPQDLVQAATELAAERFRASERIGLRSKSLGGQETISYDVSGLSASVLALIAPYRRSAL